MAEGLEQYRSQIALARTEIKNLRQQLSTLKHEHLKEIKTIKLALSGMSGTTPTNIDSIPSTSDENSDNINYSPIGIIETTFQNKRGVPRQPSVMSNAHGTVVIDTNVFNNPDHALSGLEEFSHMWIIFHFHMTESTSMPAKVAPPRLGGERCGVFSTRSPHRPCPIGLSLVKIRSIEGNKIHFLGVDMVNGTPVLDIKPYIPQYDYPSFEAIPSERPLTEGISDVVEPIAALSLDEPVFDRSLSPRITNLIGVETSGPLPRSPFEDTLQTQSNVTPVSPSPDSPSSADLEAYRTRSPIRRPDSERGAPDGQERFTPPHTSNMSNVPQDGIRIAPWIVNPPSQSFEVRFTDDASSRLRDLLGNRAQAFKTNVESLLSDDPRSHYVRTRYPDHEYSCVLEDLSLSCVFDSNSKVCTIIAIRSAEDMQN